MIFQHDDPDTFMQMRYCNHYNIEMLMEYQSTNIKTYFMIIDDILLNSQEDKRIVGKINNLILDMCELARTNKNYETVKNMSNDLRRELNKVIFVVLINKINCKYSSLIRPIYTALNTLADHIVIKYGIEYSERQLDDSLKNINMTYNCTDNDCEREYCWAVICILAHSIDSCDMIKMMYENNARHIYSFATCLHSPEYFVLLHKMYVKLCNDYDRTINDIKNSHFCTFVNNLQTQCDNNIVRILDFCGKKLHVTRDSNELKKIINKEHLIQIV